MRAGRQYKGCVLESVRPFLIISTAVTHNVMLRMYNTQYTDNRPSPYLGLFPGVAAHNRIVQHEHRLGHLDGQEQRQKVADSEATAAGLERPRLPVGPELFTAHTLDELQERGLFPRDALHYVAGKDLVQDIGSLNVDEDLVYHDT